MLTAVQSAQIRETPGQIGNYAISRYGPLPRQIGLYFDADAVSVVNEFDEANFERFTYLDYVTSALAYRFVDQPRVLVIGAGGGADVLSALWHGAAHVTAIEMDPNVLSMMRTTLRTFSGAVYDRPDVTAVLAEGRGFLASRLEEFDLIHLPLFGAFTAAAAGVYTLNESYLYTLEAFKLYLSRLSERGVLSINCWLKTPPCDAIKLFATAVEALESSGIRDPAQHVVFIRSWNNATILVTRSPLSDEHVAVARKFCADRGFDLGHCPGIEPAEANQYTIMDRPIYYETAQAILSPNRETFYATYPFYVRPATDDRPYFFQFFRWDQLPRMLQDMQAQWVPFVEWGYLALVATLLQSFAASLLLVLLPLAVFARGPGHRGAKRWVLLYFAGLGVAYMFLEIAFIQKFILFLAYPVYAVAVVLVALLVFSGFGSLFAGTRQVRPATRVASAVLAMAVLAGAYQVVLPRAFDAWAAWPDAMKILATVLLLAPIAFCMGIPFPTGLQIVSDRYRSLLPWAWGINGCASVVGATLATCTAVHFGFRMVVAAALGAYVLAAIALNRLCRLLSTTQE
jgi:spermidine synthase